MNEYQKTLVSIFLALIPLIAIPLRIFFTPAEVRSKKKQEHLDALFQKALLPLAELLNDKESGDIGTETIEKLDKIFKDNFDIIPENMYLLHEDLLMCFNKNGAVKEGLYDRYKKRIKTTFSLTRDKLGFGKKSYLVELEMLPFSVKFILVVLYVAIAILAILCLNIQIPFKTELIVFLLSAYILIIIFIIFVIAFARWFTKNHKKEFNKLKKKLQTLFECLKKLCNCLKKLFKRMNEFIKKHTKN